MTWVGLQGAVEQGRSETIVLYSEEVKNSLVKKGTVHKTRWASSGKVE